MKVFKYSFYLAIGLLQGICCYAQKKKLKPKAITVKVMTYNIRHGVNDLGQTNLLRVVELLKKHQPDFVALQEIDSGVTRSGKLNQMRILSMLSGYNEVFAKAIDFQGGKYGLGILSKHDIESVQQLKLPNPNSTEPRILMCTTVAFSDSKYVRFCNTHLDNRSPLNRGLQAAVINEYLKNSLYPVILGGDFNAEPSDHTLEALTKYWNDAGQNTEGATYPNNGKRIDYFWTHKESKVKIIDYQVLYEPNTSDHQPVVATYSF